MSENFNTQLLNGSSEIDRLMDQFITPEIKDQLNRARVMYIDIQNNIDKIKSKLDIKMNENAGCKHYVEFILKFINEVEKIPLATLTEKEILLMLYNYNVNKAYLDELEFAFNDTFKIKISEISTL